MAEQRPVRRRKLSPKEQKALEKQLKKQREIDRKRAKEAARYREEARKQARKSGGDSHVVVTIPAEDVRRRPAVKPSGGKRKKSIPDIISAETDRRVRDLPPTDHRDGYYVNEVEIRREQAERQRTKRRKSQPKPMSPKKRRIRRIVVSVSILMCVVIIGIVLSFTVLFKTESIVVKGNKYYDDDTIIQLSGVVEGENIFLASAAGDSGKIVNTLPYVRSAELSFQIPHTVVIKITHETPHYSLKSGKSFYLVNKEGRLLEKSDKRNKKLTLITAPKLKNAEIGQSFSFDSERTTKALKAISQSIVKNKYKNITAINVKKISNITITYDSRIKIELGFPDDIDYKIRTAFTIINEKLDPNNSGRVRGVLDVSECNITKKSYFREGYAKATQPTQDTDPTAANPGYSAYTPADSAYSATDPYSETEPDYYETQPTTEYRTTYYSPPKTVPAASDAGSPPVI